MTRNKKRTNQDETSPISALVEIEISALVVFRGSSGFLQSYEK